MIWLCQKIRWKFSMDFFSGSSNPQQHKTKYQDAVFDDLHEQTKIYNPKNVKPIPPIKTIHNSIETRKKQSKHPNLFCTTLCKKKKKKCCRLQNVEGASDMQIKATQDQGPFMNTKTALWGLPTIYRWFLVGIIAGKQ